MKAKRPYNKVIANPSSTNDPARFNSRIAEMAGAMRLCDIAEKLGVSESYCRLLASRAGVSVAFVKHRWTPEDDLRLVELYQRGMSFRRVAEIMGVGSRDSCSHRYKLLVRDGKAPKISGRGGRPAKGGLHG